MVHNPPRNLVYVTNRSDSSVSVIRDSDGAVDERPHSPVLDRRVEPTVTNSMPDGVTIFDAMGRRVENPRSGIYFVREEPQAASLKPQAVRKVILQR